METPPTCWSLVRDAAEGAAGALEAFALRYESPLRAYLGARWRGTRNVAHVDDAVQDVFLECIKEGGVLGKADPGRSGGFRAFLYGVARRVALRYETGHGRKQADRLSTEAGQAVEADAPSLSRLFDQAFAQATMREAVRRQTELAAERGDEALARVELLRLRFQEGLPIREIAKRWEREPALVHRAYAKARAEFREALLEVIEFNGASTRKEAEERAAELFDMLGT